MRTFLTSSDVAFMFSDDSQETASVVTDTMPSIADMREFLAFVDEDRRGPQLAAPANVVIPGDDWLAPLLGIQACVDVPTYANYALSRGPLFLVNGTFMEVQQDESLPKGTIVYVAPDGSRTTLLASTADVDTHGIAWG